jgi:leader peptidase (prepilin peptidase)/N-methyltransferase
VTYLAAATITSALVALTLIDWDWQILPDPITKGGMLLGPVFLLAAPGLQPNTAWIHAVKVAGIPLVETIGVRGVVALHGVVGEIVAGGSLWVIGALGSRAFGREAMGFGDVKMLAAMGGVLGLWALLALGVAALVGAVVGIAMKGAGRGRYAAVRSVSRARDVDRDAPRRADARRLVGAVSVLNVVDCGRGRKPAGGTT